MKKKEFQNLPSTDTPITAENLNEMQSNIEESCVIVSPTEPTTNEKVWLNNAEQIVYIKNENGEYVPFYQDSGWQKLTETGESYASIKYRKSGKMLEINSRWYSETGVSVGAYGNLLLGTLPEGFRPSETIELPILCKNNANTMITACGVKINSDGTIQLINQTGSSISNICVIYFHTMCFVA